MLVSSESLSRDLGALDLVVVDLRWREDGSGRARYEASHIPGAVFLDWTTDLVDPEGPYAFMLAPAERLGAVLSRFGIGDDSRVVAYADQHGSGPFRLWWACRVFGHDNVRVLDGGFDKWAAEGRPATSEVPEPSPAVWTPRPGPPLMATAEDVMVGAERAEVVVLDSRPPTQFRGKAVWFETGPVPAGPDGIAHTPRGDLRAGHVPWAKNVPAAQLYREDLTLRSAAELRDVLAAAGAEIGAGHRFITYCGVGISASALLFALVRAGAEDVALYDASWEEWGRDLTRPVAREPALSAPEGPEGVANR